ncbi:MAG: hypothetical protein FDX21_02880 [Chlorobium sp.]|nr:MAG: hypothetical protein FDX21_02880 [Chlorobium sp.]
MAAEKPVQSLLPLEGTFYAVRLGAILILLSTTVPYLMLLNGFLFAGIFLAGVVALHKTILRFQVALTFREAFVLGCMVGFAGGVLSEAVSFFLIGLFHYRPERETLVFVIDKAFEMAKGRPDMLEQLQPLVVMKKQVLEPLSLTFVDLLMNITVAGTFYAPITGLGGAYAVRRLKRRVARG